MRAFHIRLLSVVEFIIAFQLHFVNINCYKIATRFLKDSYALFFGEPGLDEAVFGVICEKTFDFFAKRG